VPIRVDQDGEDAVGQRFAFDLRDAIRRSVKYCLVEAAFGAPGGCAPNPVFITIDVQSLSIPPGDVESAISAMVQMTGGPSCLDEQIRHRVMVLGKERVTDAAKHFLAYVDRERIAADFKE
jgi:hypothetical protein